MGNASSSSTSLANAKEKEKDKVQDSELISLLNSSDHGILSDAMVNMMYSKLSIEDDSTVKTSSTDSEIASDDSIQQHPTVREPMPEERKRFVKLMGVLGPRIATNRSIMNIPELTRELEVSKSLFQQMNKKRLQVLLRAFQVYHQILDDHGTASSAPHGAGLLPFPSLIEQSESDVSVSEQPGDLMTSMSIEMCTSIAQSLGKQTPGLFNLMAERLIAVLSTLKPLSLRMTAETILPALIHSMESILEMGKEMSQLDDPVVQAGALGLILSVALTTGSLAGVVEVVLQLINTTSKLSLPDSVRTLIKKYAACNPVYTIEIQPTKFAAEKFVVDDLLPDDEKKATFKKCPAVSAIASDGASVFIFDGTCSSCGLYSVGTGLHGSLKGAISVRNEKIVDDIAQYFSTGSANEEEVKKRLESIKIAWEDYNGAIGLKKARNDDNNNEEVALAGSVLGVFRQVSREQEVERGSDSSEDDSSSHTESDEGSDLYSSEDDSSDSSEVDQDSDGSVISFPFFDVNLIADDVEIDQDQMIVESSASEFKVVYLEQELDMNKASLKEDFMTGALGNYFEIRILAMGWTVAFGFANPDFHTVDCHKRLGENDNSFGYDSRTGSIRGEESLVTHMESFNVGDVVGCGLDLQCDGDGVQRGRIFYTKNGVSQGIAFHISGRVLRPVIVLKTGDTTGPCKVKVNTGREPFAYTGDNVYIKGSNKTDSENTRTVESIIGSVAVGDENIFLRAKDIMKPSEIAVFDKKKLQLKSVIDVTDCLMEQYIELEMSTQDENISPCGRVEFIFNRDENVDIRTKNGRSIKILSAHFVDEENNEVNVIDHVQSYLNESASVLHIDDIQDELSFENRKIKSLNVQATVMPLSENDVRENAKLEIEKSLCLPISTVGNSLVVLQATHVEAKNLAKASILNVHHFVSVQRAQYESENGNIFDCVDVVKELWTAFLKSTTGTLTESNWTEFWSKLNKLSNSTDVENVEGIDSPVDNDEAEVGVRNSVSDGEQLQNNDGTVEVTSAGVAKSKLSIEWKINNKNIFCEYSNNSSFDLTTILGIAFEEIHPTSELRVSFIDIQDDLSVSLHKQFTVDPDGHDGKPLRASYDNSLIVSNGSQLYIIPAKGGKGKRFDLYKKGEENAILSNGPFVVAQVQEKVSPRLCYDIRNNMIFSYDATSAEFVRWVNRGHAPQLRMLNWRSHLHDSTICPVPQIKLQQYLLNETANESKESEAAALLAVLENVSIPYRPTDWQYPSAADDVRSKITILAAPPASSQGLRYEVIIRGQRVDWMVDTNQTVEGDFYVVTLTKNFTVAKVRVFLTNENDEISMQIADFINDLAPGTVTIICTCEAKGRNMPNNCRTALRSLGACDLKDCGVHNAFVMIGVKGMQEGQATQRYGGKEETCVINCTIPPVNVPLTVEVNERTILILIDAVSTISPHVLSSAEMLNCLFSAVKILSVNLHHIRFMAFNKIDQLLSEETKNRLENVISTLISSSSLLSNHPNLEYAVLELFSVSMDIIYREPEALQKLFSIYTKKYEERSIHKAEMKVLEFILKKLSMPSVLSSLVSKKSTFLKEIDTTQNKCVYDNSILDFFNDLQNLFHGEYSRKFADFLSIFDADPMGNDEDGIPDYRGPALALASINTLNSLVQLLITKTTAPLFEGEQVIDRAIDKSKESPPNIRSLIYLVSNLSKGCGNLVERSIQINDRISASKSTELVNISEDILDMLHISPLATVLPISLTTFSGLLERSGFSLIKTDVVHINELLNQLIMCQSHLSRIIELLPVQQRVYSDTIKARSTEVQVFESEHPYRPNMDEYTNVSFPGASRVEIVFDPNTRSENGCDYLQFMDMDKRNLHENQFTGRDGSQNWPGFGGRPPLVLEVNEFMFKFHSDSSVEDWGYKFSATAYYPTKTENAFDTHWLVKSSFLMTKCISDIAGALVEGQAWATDLENEYSQWMENPLVRPELFRFVKDEASSLEIIPEEDAFLRDFVDRPVDSMASYLTQFMRKRVMEDQGNIEVVNRAVYATCAAIIKCNNLTAEAMAIGKQKRKDVSPALMKAWRAGQKMRAFFDLSDLKTALSSTENFTNDQNIEKMPPQEKAGKGAKAKKRRPSQSATASATSPRRPSAVRAGAEDSIVKAASDEIVSRMNFILRTPITAPPAPGMDRATTEQIAQAASIANVTALTNLIKPTADQETGFSPSSNTQTECIEESVSPSNDHPFALSEETTPISSPIKEGESSAGSLGMELPVVDLKSHSRDRNESAAMRWKLSAKAVTLNEKMPMLRRQVSDDTKNVSNIWHSLVDETVVLDKLRNILMHRRKLAEKQKMRGAQSITEQVLSFAQSAVDIKKLDEMNSLRNKRAIMRAKGFDIFAQIIRDDCEPFSLALATNALSISLRKTCMEEGFLPSAIHYMNRVEGCSPEQSVLLYQKYATILHSCASALKRGRGMVGNLFSNETTDSSLLSSDAVCASTYRGDSKAKSIVVSEWCKALSSCIRSCALDYTTADHSLVYDSNILSELHHYLDLSQPELKETAESLFESLVGTCMKADPSLPVDSTGHVNIDHAMVGPMASSASKARREPTDLCMRLLYLMINRLASSSRGVMLQSPPPFENNKLKIVDGPRMLLNNSYGFVHAPTMDVKPRSFSMWLKRPFSNILDSTDGSNQSSVALDSCVIPGPDFDWDKESEFGGVSDTIGVVTKVDTSSHTAAVKWPNGHVSKDLLFGSKGKSKILIADPRVGGHIFSVGVPFFFNDIFVTDSDKDKNSHKNVSPYMALKMLPTGCIALYVGLEKQNRLKTYMAVSEEPLPCDKWMNVSIVFQADEITCYFNDMRAFTISLVEQFSKSIFDVTEDENANNGNVIIESDHPVPLDESKCLQEIKKTCCIADAKTLIVTFDPKTIIPKGYQLVLSHSAEDASSNECDSIVFGEEYYDVDKDGEADTAKVGGRKYLPGVRGSKPLSWPVNSVTISFNEAADVDEQLNVEESVWGFRLLIQNAEEVGPPTELNASGLFSKLPFYVGQLPFYHGVATEYMRITLASARKEARDDDNDDLVATAAKEGKNMASFSIGMKGLISNLIAIDSEVCTEKLKAFLLEKNIPENNLEAMDDTSLLGILSVVRRGLDNLDRFYDSAIRRAISDASFMETLFFLLLNSTNTLVKIVTYRICALVFPYLDVPLVVGFAVRCGYVKMDGYHEGMTIESADILIMHLLATVGGANNVWDRLYQSNDEISLRAAAEAEYGLSMARASLLKAMSSSTYSSWRADIGRIMKQIIERVPAQIEQHCELAKAEFTNNVPAVVPVDSTNSVSFDDIYGVLVLMGGFFPVLYPGCMATYININTNLKEDCIILGYSSVPKYDAKKDKEMNNLWGDCLEFGGAVTVMMINDPKNCQVVPMKCLNFNDSLNNSGDGNEDASDRSTFYSKIVGTSPLMDLLTSLTRISTIDPRPTVEPRIVSEQVELVFESEHPYNHDQDVWKDICIPGAEQLVITFDDKCVTELNCDYLQFFKDNKRVETLTNRLSGEIGKDSWLSKKLIVASSSAVMHFYSDGSGNDWGYKFTVQGIGKKEVIPPPLPVCPHFAQLVHLKMLGMKAFRSMADLFPWMVPSMLPLLEALVQGSLAPTPRTIIKKKAKQPLTLTFESNHPYENSLDAYTPISIPGAEKLIVSFDEETKTESGCDYLVFYVDDNHSARVPGTDKYSGGHEGTSSNFPGMNGRPPLEIDGDNFVLYFHTDGSVNSWGYKMEVTGHFKNSGDNTVDDNAERQLRGQGMDASTAAFHCYHIQQYQLDVRSVDESEGENVDGFEFKKVPAREHGDYHIQCAQDFVADINAAELSTAAAESKEESSLVPLLEEKPSVRYLSNMDQGILAVDSAAPVINNVGGRSLWPQTFRVDAFTVYVYPDIDSVFDPNKSPLTTLSNGDIVRVLEARGDCLRVTCEKKMRSESLGSNSPGIVFGASIESSATISESKVVAKANKPGTSKRAQTRGKRAQHKLKTSAIAVSVAAEMSRISHQESDPSQSTQSAETSGLTSFLPPHPSFPFVESPINTPPATESNIVNDESKGVSAPDAAVPFGLQNATEASLQKLADPSDCEADSKLETESKAESMDNLICEGWIKWRDADNEYVSLDSTQETANANLEVQEFVQIPALLMEDVIKTSKIAQESTSTEEHQAGRNSSGGNRRRRGGRKGKGSNKSSKDKRHPMYAVQDTPEGSEATDGIAGVRPVVPELISQEIGSLNNALFEYSVISAIGYCSDIARLIIERWPDDLPLSVRHFGSFDLMISFLNLSLESSKPEIGLHAAHEKVISRLKSQELKHIQESNGNLTAVGRAHQVKLPEVCMGLVRFAISTLEEASQSSEDAVTADKSSSEAPSMKAVQKVFESAHPFQMSDNDNEDTINTRNSMSCNFPGAKRIIIRCDAQTNASAAIEVLDKQEGGTVLLSINLAKKFADKRAKTVKIAGSTCYLRCVQQKEGTSSGSEEWGYKLNVYGIYKDAKDKDIAKYKELLLSEAKDTASKNATISTTKVTKSMEDNSTSRATVQLACWIISSYIDSPSSELRDELFSVHTFSVLRKLYTSPSGDYVEDVILELFVAYMNAFSGISHPRKEIIDELNKLKAVIVEKVGTLYANETFAGVDMMNISPKCQAMVQLALSLHNTTLLLVDKIEADFLSSNDFFASEGDGNLAICGAEVKDDVSGQMTSLGLPSFKRYETNADMSWPRTLHASSLYGEGEHYVTLIIKSLHAQGNLPLIGLIRGTGGDTSVDQFFVALSGSNGRVLFGERVDGTFCAEANLCVEEYARALQTGDWVTICINIETETISFFVNGAYLGIAMGPLGSGAAIEFPLGGVLSSDGEDSLKSNLFFTPAVRVYHAEDEISFVETPPAVHYSFQIPEGDVAHDSKMNGHSNGAADTVAAANSTKESKSELPEWLSPAWGSYSLLLDIATNQVPRHVLVNKFVPFCMNLAKVPIQIDNASFDWTTRSVQKSATFSGAYAVKVVIIACELCTGDRLQFIDDESGDTLMDQPSSGSKYGAPDNMLNIIDFVNELGRQSASAEGMMQIPLRYVPDSKRCNVSNSKDAGAQRLTTMKIPEILREGDKVVRGPSWCWYGQDGGIGAIGTVLAVVPWKFSVGKGVKVRWTATGHEGVYRFGHENKYDVVPLFAEGTDTERTVSSDVCQVKAASGKSTSAASAMINPLTYNTSKLSIRILAGDRVFTDGAEPIRKFSCYFVPCYSVQGSIANPMFNDCLDQLRSLYVARNHSENITLAKHVDTVAQRMGWTDKETVLNKKWTDFVPTKDDITRSPILKALHEAEALQAVNLPGEDAISKEIQIERKSAVTSADPPSDLSFVLDAVAMAARGDATEVSWESMTELDGPHEGYVLEEYADWAGIHEFGSLEEALEAAKMIFPECRGITKERQELFTLRRGVELIASSADHISWRIPKGMMNPGFVEGDNAAAAADNETDVITGFENMVELSEVNVELSQSNDENEEEADEVEYNDSNDNGDDNSSTNSSVPDLNQSRSSGYAFTRNSSEQNGRSGSDSDSCSSSSRSCSDSESNSDSTSSGILSHHRRHVERVENGEDNPCCFKCGMRCALRENNYNGWICDWPRHKGRNEFSRSDELYACPTAVECDWGICAGCWTRISNAFEAKKKPLSSTMQNQAINAENKPIAARFSLLQLLNITLKKTLPLLDLSLKAPVKGSLVQLLLQYRGLVFAVVKEEPIEKAISATRDSGARFDLRLSRSRAAKFLRNSNGQPDNDGQYAVFSQAFRTLHTMPVATLRNSDQIYNTMFMGEYAQDAGGPYRETFAMYAKELQSSMLPLLIRTPNGRQAVGYNREKWILNPGAVSSTHMAMFVFLGKLMGIALRSKEFLALNIPSIIWKLLVRDTPNVDDLTGIDYSITHSLELLRNFSDAEMFENSFFETFTTSSSDDRIIELIPNGSNVDVKFETRHQYCDLVLQYRLHEFDKAAEAVRSGMACIVPMCMLSLWTWDQLEEQVCGKAEVDIDLLQQMTEYSSCNATDDHVRYFWQTLRDFSPEERSALIRFTWGRSRLPLNASGFQQNFKIQSFNKSPPDAYYPVAHTCFFSLELPRYSSLQVMKDKLRYAIFNCEAIDGDDTSSGMAAAAMGWED